MASDQSKTAAGLNGRPTGMVPKLNLNEIGGATSKSRSISKKDSKINSTTTTYTKMATPRFQTSSPSTNGSHGASIKNNQTAAGASRSTPDIAATAAGKKTPASSSGVSFTPRRNNSGGDCSRQTSGGNRNDYSEQQPLMTPRGGSYKDMLLTPRGTIRPLGEQHIINAMHPKQRHTAPPPPKPSLAPTQQEQQQKVLKQKVDRASQEKTHVKQQISTLDAAIQAQQAALIENIALVQSLGKRRDRLANDVTTLQAAVARANEAASARQAEIQVLEVVTAGLQATLQAAHKEEEEKERNTDQATASAIASKTQALMHVMQAAAAALHLPSVTLALETELKKQQQNQQNMNRQQEQQGVVIASRGAGTSNAVTARSDISTSRFVSPTGTGRESCHEEDSIDTESVVSSSNSSEKESMDSSNTGIAEEDIPPAADAACAGADGAIDPTTSNASKSTATGKLHRPGMNVPLLQLPTADTIPAHFNNNSSNNILESQVSARMPSANPQALARLQSIRNKLEMAEAILTARVPEDGEDSPLQNP